MVDAIEATRTLLNKILHPSVPLKLEIREGKVLNSDTGEEYDVSKVAARLLWRAQLGAKSRCEDYPPYMPPHGYIVFEKCDYADWDVLYFACMNHPASYRGYFRGYSSPMRYWEAGDGYRYWPSAHRGVMMLNRCTLDSVEPPRRVDQGARRIKPKDWGEPPWLPQGNGWPPSYLRKIIYGV